jgi:acetoin utilization deacetylase AcuC-like enzyme
MRDIIFYYPEGHQNHFEMGHPERPERVEVIKQAFQAVGLWEDSKLTSPLDPTIEFVSRIHQKNYLDMLQDACRSSQHLDMDTYTTPATWDLALHTAGGAMAVAQAVWRGGAKRGFALCRPPGHHATPGHGMGFCILNNIALSAEFLIVSEQANRLAIVDFDLHHGNGTQEIFWYRGDVFYVSTHQSPLYPGTGSLLETGDGAGMRKNLNLPLPPGSGDQAFQASLEEVILPVLEDFQPEMVLVSYGFDPHWRDPLGSLQLSAQGYGKVISTLTKWVDLHCGGKIAIFLEGGYDLEAAAACSLSVIYNMLGEEWDDSLGYAPHPEGHSWQAVVKQAKEIWHL